MKPGDEPPLHTHSREDELVFVESGRITAVLGETEVDVEAGAFAALPRGIPHTIRVNGDSATLLLTVIPAGVERFFVPASEDDKKPETFGLTIHETDETSKCSTSVCEQVSS